MPENEPLAVEDARALTRLMRRTLGRGFRLVVIEVDTPRLRRRIVEWLQTQVQALDGRVRELDVRTLARENLWSELRTELEGEDLERLVLALHGFQEAEHGRPDPRAGVYRQLNVQRDLFVRDVGCFWVVLVHPHGSRKLQDIAPDFSDFCSFWVQAPRDANVPQARIAAMPMGTISVGTVDGSQAGEPSALLTAAQEAIEMGRYEHADDMLARFDLASDVPAELQGQALRLRTWLELQRGKVDAAHEAAARALAWSQARADDKEISSSQFWLAGVFVKRGEFARARELLERALEPLSPRERDSRGNPALASIHAALGQVLKELGQFEEARRHLERALELRTVHSRTGAKGGVIDSLREMAAVSLQIGEVEAARRDLERALALEIELYGTDRHPAVAVTLQLLAAIAASSGEIDQARQHIERALNIQRGVFGSEDHPDIADSLRVLAVILRQQGELEQARELLERVLELDERLFGTQDNPRVAMSLYELVAVLGEQGDFDGALATLERALQISARVYGPDSPMTCTIEVALADLLIRRGEVERARARLEHARPILLEAYGPEHAWVQLAARLLAELTAQGSTS